jgi:hypothetical protein
MEMETMGRATPLITVTNSLAIVGVSYYFYKQIATLQAELVKQSAALAATIRRLGEIDGKTQQLEQIVVGINELQASHAETKKAIEKLSNMSEIDTLAEQMELIMKALKDNGIEVSRPTPPRRRRGKKGKQHQSSARERPSNNKGKKKQPDRRRKDSEESGDDSEQASEKDSSEDDIIDTVRGRRGK